MNPAQWLGDGLGFVISSARQLPGGTEVTTWLAGAERELVRAVRAHLDDIDPPDPDDDDVALEPGDDETVTPRAVFKDLMRRSLSDSPAQSRTAVHLALLQAIVPDEARIFAAVSDGSTYPVIHVGEPGVGTAGPLVLKNASTVGRAAGVAVPQRTPLYVTHMLRLGLVVLGPPDATMRDDYEMLLTDSAVHSAITSVSRGIRTARIVRRTLGISELGRQVWEEAAT
ncbi:hypothetical protein [Mycobacterium sp. 236(2023)]|uniref:Abi-alpha family protein n=1 Tax=Mycobacterium sp. 236(2023) TaxID=3038163 RepID=UPI0024157462|nr:hypothetical protein [Mycobacterium sp. 236(2023)]MDG4665583.1 hypothetical protein [Mycobacterium sp. 236(2023)]